MTDAAPRAVAEAGRRAALDAIASEIATCRKCRLHEGRTRAVPGEGHPETEVVFVGEGPGFNEDKQGRPFVGQAGALLGELLESVGWSRNEVFITNVVKCRPPGNRDPEQDEIAACAPFLTRQLEVLDPALVVTLGRFSMARFAPDVRITQVHGTFRQADAESGAPRALTYAMYHPAAALHKGSLKATLMRDMEGIPDALLEARARRAAGPSQGEPGTEMGLLEPGVEPAASEPAAGEPVAFSGGQTEGSSPTAQTGRTAPDSEIRVSTAIGEAAASQIAPEAESKPAAQLTLF